MEAKQWHFDTIRLNEIDKFRHLDKNYIEILYLSRSGIQM